MGQVFTPLFTICARRMDEAAVFGWGDNGLEAAVFKAEDAHAVGVLAARDAAAAEDAL